MKTSTLLIAMFVGFLTSSVTAQETIWFDSNWNLTTKDKAEYYRPTPKKVTNGFWLIDYYMNGKKQMEGFSTSNVPLKEFFEGQVLYYHPNGKLFHKANYKNGELQGKRDIYYETGELKERGRYVKGKRNGIWKTFYKNGKIESKGKYTNGEKAGVWKTFYKNGN